MHAAAARQAVLSFFNAPPDYTVVFTANASAALKLVGESFPFSEGSSYVLGADSHNSVHGIRQFATRRGAQVHYIECTSTGGVDFADTLVRIHLPSTTSPGSGLLIMLQFRTPFRATITQTILLHPCSR